MDFLKGVGVSPGIAIGRVFLKEDIAIEIKNETIQNPEEEIKRFKDAIEKSKQQLQELYEYALKKVGKHEAQVFAAHTMILEDEELIEKVNEKIRTEFKNVEWALKEASDEYISIFEAMDNEYLKERALDIRDVTLRMLRNLLGIEDNSLVLLKEPVIIVAKDLTPSDTAQMDKDKVLGFITEEGGKTSHSAIIARSLEIPAVAGLDSITLQVKHGDTIAFDGTEGKVYINPDEKTIELFKEKKERFEQRIQLFAKLKNSEAITKDNVRLEVACNIGKPADVDRVIEKNADGIGLFRSEFLYMNRNDFPSEEEQFNAYKTVAQRMKEKPVVIRTFDIGGDKELSYLDFPKEMNPFLGCRAIRFCLGRIDLFKTQLRAILRASVFGNIKIMFPMISVFDELVHAKQILEEVKESLRNEGIAFNENMEVGMMIETPSAALLADIFAKHVDFFSIGTNDLIQYTLAVDRLNPHVSHLYSPYNPSVLRSIKNIIDAAHRENIWVGMCGEAASDPKLVPVLIGMGLDEFSMNPASVLEVKWMIRQHSREEMKAVAEQVLKFATADEIERFLESNDNIHLF